MTKWDLAYMRRIVPPLPQPAHGFYAVPMYTADQLHAHAAAVSAADNAALRAELAKHQESEFHPDWSMLEATRESLAEHQQIIGALRERVTVLEDALASLRLAVKSRGLVSTVKSLALADKALAARAALGDKT